MIRVSSRSRDRKRPATMTDVVTDGQRRWTTSRLNVGVADERSYVRTLPIEKAFVRWTDRIAAHTLNGTAVRTFGGPAIDATAWNCIVELSSGPINRKLSSDELFPTWCSVTKDHTVGEPQTIDDQTATERLIELTKDSFKQQSDAGSDILFAIVDPWLDWAVVTRRDLTRREQTGKKISTASLLRLL
jgi:hypothetical protein